MTEQELLVVQRDNDKLKSLYLELANHEQFNPRNRIAMADGVKENLEKWYMKEKERIEKEIDFRKF